MSVRLHERTRPCMCTHVCMHPCTQTCTRKWWAEEGPTETGEPRTHLLATRNCSWCHLEPPLRPPASRLLLFRLCSLVTTSSNFLRARAMPSTSRVRATWEQPLRKQVAIPGPSACERLRGPPPPAGPPWRLPRQQVRTRSVTLYGLLGGVQLFPCAVMRWHGGGISRRLLDWWLQQVLGLGMSGLWNGSVNLGPRTSSRKREDVGTFGTNGNVQVAMFILAMGGTL